LRRLHFFEIFTIVNLAAIALLARDTLTVSPLVMIIAFTAGLLPYALIGVFVRAVVAAVRKNHAYFHVIKRGAWVLETFRLVFFTGLMIYTYGWIKLAVPVLHPRLFDQELWDLDQLLFFGVSPNVLALDLFSAPMALRAIDWSYANIFYVSIVVALSYFFSHPIRRVRIAFANGNTAMWLTGAWLYMLIPSLGPAFRFPDLYFVYEASLRRTQSLQALLMQNYVNVHRYAAGRPPNEPIRIVFGIAAFPSLHVAFQTYVFLWMRRLWTSGEVLFGFFVFAIFLGSIVTGWHYVIDGLGGILLAWACYAGVRCFSRYGRSRRSPRTAHD
jgi:hypothetical protein